MNIIGNLSSIALFSVLNVSPCFALSHFSSVGLSDQSSSSQSEPIRLAGFFGDTVEILNGVLDTVEQERRRQEERETRQQAERERQEREAEQQRRQAELEATRQAASEQERLEAERRRQYFESLSPEEQQAYIEEQQAMQAQRDQAAAIFWLTILSAGFSSEPGIEESSNDTCVVYNSDGTMSHTTTRDQASSYVGAAVCP